MVDYKVGRLLWLAPWFIRLQKAQRRAGAMLRRRHS